LRAARGEGGREEEVGEGERRMSPPRVPVTVDENSSLILVGRGGREGGMDGGRYE
jgi:hypothetical protein